MKVQQTSSVVKAGAVLHTLCHGRYTTPKTIVHIMSNNNDDRESNSTGNVTIESGGKKTEKNYLISNPFLHTQSYDNVMNRMKNNYSLFMNVQY